MNEENTKKGLPNGGLVVLGYLKAHGITQKEIASLLQLHRVTVNRRLHGHGSFTTDEVTKMHRSFGIPIELFF